MYRYYVESSECSILVIILQNFLLNCKIKILDCSFFLQKVEYLIKYYIVFYHGDNYCNIPG